MDGQSWVLIFLTAILAAKVVGMARKAWPRLNPFRRWLTVAWHGTLLPPLCVEAAMGVDEPFARILAALAVAIQAVVAFAIRRYCRSVGLPPEALEPARHHVATLYGLTAAYLPMLVFPTQLTAFVMLFSGIWMIAPLYAWARGAMLWKAVGAWS